MSIILLNEFFGGEGKTPKINYKEVKGKYYKQNPSGGKWVEVTEKEYNDNMGLDELVDEKGGKISGDYHIDQSGKATSSLDTTDDHVRKVRQGDPFYRRYYSENKTFDEISRDKMKSVVEDVLSGKNYGKEVIDRVKYENGIPDVDVVKDDFPVLVRKIAHIKTLLDREEVNGETKAILLNSLLSVNLTDIPQPYKKELNKKIG